MSWFERNFVMKMMFIVFLAIITIFICLPLTGQATGQVELKVNPGLSGEYKPQGFVPIMVEVSNHGENVEGDLLIELSNHYNYSGTYYQPLSLATGAVKKVSFLVPGEGLSPSTEVKLVSKGEELAKQKIGGRSLGQDTLLVGVLASDLETGNFLATLPKNKFPMPVRVIPLHAEELPTLWAGWQSLNIVVINNYALENLSNEQLVALKEWTRQGGLLVLAGGPHYRKLANAVKDIAPAHVEGTTQLVGLTELAQLAGSNLAPPNLERPMTISKATSVTGQVLAQVEETPLFVVKQIGNGRVLYVAYDLSEQPLATWSENGSLWAQTLLRVNGGPHIASGMGELDSLWPLNRAANYIPALQLPSLSLLAMVFGVYILVAGPILYFVLKRFGRREWLWFIVPSLATLFALGIYLYGSFERTNQVLAHHVSFVELTGEEGNVRGISAIFVPTGGDYTLRLQEGGTILPNDNNYYSYDQQVSDTWVSLGEEQAEVTFKNVEFWSMRKAAIQSKQVNLGDMTADLHYGEGKLVGTVTNNTELTLRDVRLVHGRHVQEIERFLPGESIDVELAFDTAIQGGRGLGASQRLIGQMSNHEAYLREESMLEILNYHHHTRFQPVTSTSPVTLIGWTEEELYALDIPGNQKKDYYLALVKANLDVQPREDGYVFYPAGTFEAMLTESQVQVDYLGDGYMLPAGEVTFEFQLDQEPAEQRKLAIEQIHLYTWSDDGTRFLKQVYNWQTATYDDYEHVFEKNKLSKEKLETYLSADGVLRIKMEHQQPDYRHLGHPAVSVEGMVQH